MKDGLYSNCHLCNYNFVRGGSWNGWSGRTTEDAMWLRWQGNKTLYPVGVWKRDAELKIPVEYLT